MIDDTESLRREIIAEQQADGRRERADLEVRYGEVWNTKELQEAFRVESFMAPFVIVRRKSDGRRGTLEFRHDPRLYYDFQPV